MLIIYQQQIDRTNNFFDYLWFYGFICPVMVKKKEESIFVAYEPPRYFYWPFPVFYTSGPFIAFLLNSLRSLTNLHPLYSLDRALPDFHPFRSLQAFLKNFKNDEQVLMNRMQLGNTCQGNGSRFLHKRHNELRKQWKYVVNKQGNYKN